jgi:hypothetical protein
VWSLSEMVDRRWNRTWIGLGAASAFHVLVGGWSVIAAMIAWFTTERKRSDRRPLITPSLFVGGALALFGLVPALWLTLDANPEDRAAAARIYTYFRIKHHLLPSDFPISAYLGHGFLVVSTAALAIVMHRRSPRASWSRLYGFTAGAVLIAAVGLCVGMLPAVAPDLAAKLLRYYWFRLTDAAAPMLFALLTIRAIAEDTIGRSRCGWAILLVSIGAVAFSGYDRIRLGVPPATSHRILGWDRNATPATQRQVLRDWIEVCRWAQAATDQDAVFLTPRHQQTFKWYAERAEVVNWKDVPQDAVNLKEWYRRFFKIFPRRLGTVRTTIQYDRLLEYRQRYSVPFMIVDRRVVGTNLPLVKVYPTSWEQNGTFAVYALPYAPAGQQPRASGKQR